jgi:hypothetical protein
VNDKPPPRPDLDFEAGYIDQAVVRNVFTVTLRKLDELVPSSERYPVKQLVTELFESAKYAILKQRKTIPEILGKTPMELKGEAVPSQKEGHDKRLAAMKGRQ